MVDLQELLKTTDPAALLRVVKARRIRDSFYEFVKAFWSVADPASVFIPAFHVDALCQHLQAVSEGRIRNLLICIPPGHGKSLITAVLWPAWQWLRNPSWQLLAGSHSLQLSIRDASRAREVMRSSEYLDVKLALGGRWQFSQDQDLKQYYKNDAGGHRMAMSVTGGATGHRGNTLMFDDLVNVKDEITSEKLDEAKNWWNVTMSSRGNDPKVLQKVGIMQRVADNDPVADLAARKRSDGSWEYELLLLPTEYDPEIYEYYGREKSGTSIGWQDWRSAPGDLLFPEYFDARAVEDAKATLGSMTYSANHAQRPVPASGGFFKQRWWRFWFPEGASVPPPVRVKMPDGGYEECVQVSLPETVSKYLSCDLTFKGGKNSDFVALQVWAYGAKAPYRSSFFLLDQTHRRADFPQTLAEIHKLVEKHPDIGVKLIEDAANGPAVISTLRDKMTGVIAVPPLGGKTARANAVAPAIEGGNVYLPHPKYAPWVQGLLAELASFPLGKHDDQVDAMTQALARKRVVLV